MRFYQCLFCAVALCLSACTTLSSPPPSAGDCKTIRLWSNGWHTNIALPATLLPPAHPMRKLFPDANYFLVGWGERDFYMVRNPGLFKGLKAILPPSPTVIQVLAADEPVEDNLWPASDLAEFAISQTGAEQLAESLASALKLDEKGLPIILEKGRLANAGYFLAARGNFSLINMCNHWTARRLRDAGVPVSQTISFTAPGLMSAVRRKMPPSCQGQITPSAE